VVRLVEIDSEVDPFALRGDLKFFVTPNVAEVATNESLCHIPVPKLVRFSRGTWIGFEIELFVRTDKQDVKIPLRPTRSNFRPILGVTLAVSVLVHVNRQRAAPKRRVNIRVKRRIRIGPNALDGLIPTEGVACASQQEHQIWEKSVDRALASHILSRLWIAARKLYSRQVISQQLVRMQEGFTKFSFRPLSVACGAVEHRSIVEQPTPS